MEAILTFYRGLPKQKRIVVWVAAAVIVLSALNFVVWRSRQNRIPKPKQFVRALTSSNKYARKDAVYTVGVLKVAEAAPALEKIVREEKDLPLRRSAAASLGKIDPARLAALADAPDRETKFLVFETMMSLDPAANAGLLVERLPKADAETKLKIISLVAARPGFDSQILAVAENKDEALDIRLKALEALKATATPAVESRLWNLYYNDPEQKIRTLAQEVVNAAKGVKQ